MFIVGVVILNLTVNLLVHLISFYIKFNLISSVIDFIKNKRLFYFIKNSHEIVERCCIRG